MKKVISLLLSVIMIFSLASTAFAAPPAGIDKFVDEITSNVETTKNSIKKIVELSKQGAKNLEPVIKDFVLDSNNWEKAADVMLQVIVKVFDKVKPENPDEPENPDKPVDPENPDKPVDPENPDKPVDPDKPENPDEPDTPVEPDVPGITDIIKDMTIEDFVNLMKKYFFVNLDDIDQTSQDIVDMAEYKFVTTEDGEKTVYIVIDLEKHPELLNRDLMMETVKKLYEKQNEEFDEDADILMSYEHIAGELALHAILYAVTNEYLEITGKTEGRIYNLWVRAKQVDLNFDESRVPSELIQIVGTYIMGVFIVSFYTLFKSFK